MRRFRKSTIKEVAKEAGVSTTTVSLFVSGRESVCSPETAERIRKAISTLHYTPSSLVSSMQRRATTTLGVCMESPLDPHVAYGRTYFERLWRGVVAEADAENYSLLHYPASVRKSDRIEAFLDGRIDGLLYHAADANGVDTRPHRLVSAGMPAVLVMRSLDLPDGAGAVYTNETATVELALNHLWGLGHRRIAHVAGPVGPGGDIAQNRLQAYQRWMQTRGAYDGTLEGYAGGWRCEDSIAGEIVRTLKTLADPPTAVFCANDTLALSVCRAARALDWKVPENLSVVGVDNTPEAVMAELTSVEPPDELVGRMSVRALIQLLQGAPVADCRLTVPVTNVFPRKSTGRLNRAS